MYRQAACVLHTMSLPTAANYVYSDICAHVYDGIYIGSVTSVTTEADLLAKNITVVIDLSGWSYTRTRNTCVLRMDDTDVQISTIDDYIGKFNKGSRVIRHARARGQNVLVHCAAGINRSATQIAYYLIQYENMSYTQAIRLLESANERRNLPVLTNRTFRDLLAAFAASCTRMLTLEGEAETSSPRVDQESLNTVDNISD